MAVTENSYTGNGSTTNYSFTFPYLKSTDILVQVDQVTTTAWSLANATTIQFNSAPANGAKIKILRDTNVDNLTATFYAGSAIKSEDLNDNFTQNLYVTQEVGNRSFENTGTSTMIGNLQMGEDNNIIFEGATDNAYETTLTVADPTADRTITLPNVTGTVVTTGDTGTVTSTMIADDAIGADQLATNAVTNASIADGTIINTDINASADIAGSKLADGSIATAKIADDAITTAKITNSNVTTAKIADDAITQAKIADDAVGADQLASNAVVSASIADGSVVNADVNASAAIAHSKLAAVPDGQIIVGNSSTVPTAVAVSGDATLANDGALTIANDAIEIGMIGCEQTTISDSDSHIPTSGAVVDYVAAQLEPFGGLEAIATEVAFPNTQPASGVIISIADAGGIVVNGSGTSTTGRTVGGSTVTINNINSAFNSSTVDAGVSFMVSSTGSGQVYNFHKATLKESDIINLSNDIDDFGNRYRVHNGEPDSNNDDGDLVWDTNANKMKVYDATASAWTEVTSTGEFKYLFLCPAGGTGAPTLDGSIATYDLRESSNSGSAATVTSAAQLLVSINGVVQKANNGTSAPSEGFALVDANTIIFGSNLASGDSVFIVQIGSAVSIPTPGDNTVTSAKIVDGTIVNADINASAAIAGSKLADDSISEAKLDVHAAPSGTNKFLGYTSNGMEWAVPPDTVYTHPNHSGEVTSTADGATVIASNIVDEDNLKISNAGSDGQFLQKQSGDTGGLTWAAVSIPKLDAPVVTGTLEVNYSQAVTHTITNWSDDVSYTIVPTACTVGSVNTSGEFTVTIAGSGSPSYTIKATTDSLGLDDSIVVTKTFSVKLTAPTLNSPADTDTETNVAYTITSTDTNDDKLVLDLQSSNFNFVSTSHGSGSKVGNTVEVTGFTTNNPVVTVLITTAATYSVRAKAVKIDGSKPTSDWSSVDTIVISPPAFSATGGTVTTSGGNTIHTFTSNGDFVTSNQAGTIDYMIIAGGGGGSQGGGGAGGLIHSTSQSISVGTHAVVVGAGGAGNGNGGSNGSNGGNSSFNGETAIGGGGGQGGGGCGGNTGNSGGSGGGSKRDCGGGGSGTSGQGHNGGSTPSGPYQGAGGGGGKGGAGGNGSGGNSGSETGGGGGGGYTTSISGSSVCYAGGGGGGSANNNGGGNSCGGGNGGTTGGDATDGTGGGGGGNGSGSAGGDGGDGVVIISYTTP